jgi:hypothetical protein
MTSRGLVVFVPAFSLNAYSALASLHGLSPFSGLKATMNASHSTVQDYFGRCHRRGLTNDLPRGSVGGLRGR